MRSRIRLALVALFIAAYSGAVQAKVLVLVHGWAANADTWIHSGVLQTLIQNGWSDAGVVITTPSGIHHVAAPGQGGANKVYRTNLPAEAPLLMQAAHLAAELQFIERQHPGEPIILVGHSAGGVVSRLVLVNQHAPHVTMLITVASPNLGTARAVQGLQLVDSKPFFCPGPGIDFLKSMLGGDDYDYLRYSRGALVDLAPAAPGSLIAWLNQQPHPDIEYHAVIRTGRLYAGDDIVPAFSQDLNQIPALRGRARIHVTAAGHGLNPADGALIAGIIAVD